jgi:chorismate lyase/3-hydroxybenzoate synthase
LPDAALRSAVCDLYGRIRETASRAGAEYPLRFWNLIPFIHEDMEAGMDRYMVFNAGRHDALSDWLEDPSRFPSTIPTATGVGFRGRDLVVYCFAGDRPGEPTENPRQRPAYRYSDRYGPLPPCFARAMLLRVDDEPTLLVGGTASVRGENSVHVGSIENQIGETFDNLEGLVETVVHHAPGDDVRSPDRRPRDRFHDLRVYHVRPEHAELIRDRVRAHFPNLGRLELVRADICRRDLLVEIEGVARVGAAPTPHDELERSTLTAT